MTTTEARKIRLRIKRQDTREGAARWEDFDVPWEPNLNIIAALMLIRRNPVTSDGKTTTPVVWDSNCLEEICGACSMIVNGRVRQACSTLVDKLAPHGETITLAPMTKFPLVRDLIVDRTRMFESLKRIKAWIDLDGSYDLGPGPRYSQEAWAERYDLSRCFTCGTCVEVCPQVTPSNHFVGAAAVSQAHLMNLHPSGQMHADERTEALMGAGGVFDCGNAQNCVRACPKEIPLTTSLAEMMRSATKLSLLRWFKK
jgi:succinate dehydrogenase / fumarate reductase iron-sulfur subunit